MKYIGAILYIQKLTLTKTVWVVLSVVAMLAVWVLSFHPVYVIDDGVITQTTILGITEDGTTQLRDYYSLYMSLLLIIGIFVLANIVPGLLKGDKIDFLLVKPLSRTEILISCYIVGFSFLGLIFFLFFGGNWFLMGMLYGYWKINYFTGFVIVLYSIAILNAYLVLIGLISGSGSMSIILSFLFGFLLPVLFAVRERIFKPIFDSEIMHLIIDSIYYALPPIDALLTMSLQVIFFESIRVATLWHGIAIVPLLIISVIYFKNKSF